MPIKHILLFVVFLCLATSANAQGRDLFFDNLFLSSIYPRYDDQYRKKNAPVNASDPTLDSEHRFAQAALWELLEPHAARNGADRNSWKYIDVDAAINVYKLMTQAWQNNPTRSKLAQGQLLSTVDRQAEMISIRNAAIEMRKSLDPVRNYSDQFANQSDLKIYDTLAKAYQTDGLRNPNNPPVSSIDDFKTEIDNVVSAVETTLSDPKNGYAKGFKLASSKRWDAYEQIATSAAKVKASFELYDAQTKDPKLSKANQDTAASHRDFFQKQLTAFQNADHSLNGEAYAKTQIHQHSNVARLGGDRPEIERQEGRTGGGPGDVGGKK